MSEDRATVQRRYIIEGIILRRMHEKRIEGYTLEMAKEIDEALADTPQTQSDDVTVVRPWLRSDF